MPRTIAVINFKGGTGKTTTVVNLAAGIARTGRRVLAVDLDPQGGLAASLGVTFTCSLSDLLLGEATLRQVIIQARQGLDIIPSSPRLAQVERTLWRFDGRESASPRLLAQRMPGVEGYDYILLDCSPSLNYLNESGILYARELFVPVSMDYLGLVGIRQVLECTQTMTRTHREQIDLSLVIPTFYDGRQRKSREVLTILHEHFPGKVADPIRYNVRLSEAPSYQEHIYEYDPHSTGASDYAGLTERVINGR
jgi:chromosome partitioning protein